MRFHADLHVHSKYSRATSRDLDLEHLAAWACRKGIGVVGTGDFTHPAWRAELADKLVPAEPGLFRLRDDIATAVAQTLPAPCRSPVRFMLEVEISTIYKKGDRTRKIHHLIYAPDFETVDRMSARLARIGNIASDGRPILGLNSRDLLEIALEVRPRGLSGAGPYLDAVVRGARIPIRIRFHRRLLRRPRRQHFRGRDRALVRSADELAGVVPRPLSPDLEFRRPFAGQARARGDDVRLRARLLRHQARAGDRSRLCRHGRVLSRRRQVPSRWSPQMRGAAEPEGNARPWRTLPGLRGARHHRRRAPGRGAGRPQRSPGAAAADRRHGLEPGAAAGNSVRAHRHQPGLASGRTQLRPGDRQARRRACDPAIGAGGGHRACRLAAAGRGDHAPAHRHRDPRPRL